MMTKGLRSNPFVKNYCEAEERLRREASGD
jgi:hypothetical protein